MRRLTLIALSIAIVATAGTSGLAFAQEKTRAEVRQELIQAENNGLRFVSDASYPEVAPAFEDQAASLKADNDSGIDAAATGASPAGKATATAPDTAGSVCVGPVSFCAPYSGG
ncbi:DUF4148 domain-containing protein [Paraburkholderia sp. RL18-085-BIA-A]|uniref:DUF4148 domain-containing protein n=1 Tax=Paraburkholderia sp. RL18-085-BIA-A TaxID=3031633 RepID=UPI0038BAA027